MELHAIVHSRNLHNSNDALYSILHSCTNVCVRRALIQHRARLLVDFIVCASQVRQHLGVVHRRAPSVHGVIERVLLQTEQRAGVVFMVFTAVYETLGQSVCRSLVDEQPVECASAAAREHLESHTCRLTAVRPAGGARVAPPARADVMALALSLALRTVCVATGCVAPGGRARGRMCRQAQLGRTRLP